ncbi:MAG: hypothetical protein KGS61_14595 [Verrucomicrobia bacterium]|nr:hypothetical protein [Verrucomicrobiota bacterium]
MSHAQHFVDRFTEGYGWHGQFHHPPFELAGLYVDQVPADDLSRERARRHGLTIYPTIEEAVTLGGQKLAVDGVVIIGEHGDYPRNEKGQTHYPRYKFFKHVMGVFEASGRAVPVFNDKHLSTQWSECVEMVADSKRLGFPFLAGSSLPVTWRIPVTELPLGTVLEESLCVGYGGIDSYDFHGLETAQCMSERRQGGETGVRSVQAVRGPKVWEMLEPRVATRRLLFAALARSHICRARPGYTCFVPDLDWVREASPEAVAYFIEHRDGLRTTLFMLNGLVEDFTYAGLVRDTGEIVSCQMYLPMPPVRTTLADFFNPLAHHIEQMILTGQAPYPVERTLLTSGLTLSAVDSLYRGQVRIETPYLDVRYHAPVKSNFWRA